jgi:serpin B
MDLSSPTEAELARDVHAANAFSLQILARTKPAESALVSGTSLRHALGATYIGARGETAREMSAALGLARSPEEAARLARAELTAWQEARGSADLLVASRLWVDDGFTLRPEYVKTAESAFGAAPVTVQYAKPDEARRTINAWVSEKTNDRIPELLPRGSVDPTTRLVVTNAIWFKGRWELPFSKAATKDEPFTLGKKSVNVPMMHLTDTFRFAAVPGGKVLEMRYGDSQLAMVIVLPDDAQGLSRFEPSVTADALEQWTSGLARKRVSITLPRFEFRSGGPMNGALQDRGMKLAFTDRADFGGIAELRGGEPLFLSEVFHETWIAVDEFGTEAAAATGAVMRTTSLETGPAEEFRADHPFLFFIVDTKRGAILFAGRVVDPRT